MQDHLRISCGFRLALSLSLSLALSLTQTLPAAATSKPASETRAPSLIKAGNHALFSSPSTVTNITNYSKQLSVVAHPMFIDLVADLEADFSSDTQDDRLVNNLKSLDTLPASGLLSMASVNEREFTSVLMSELQFALATEYVQQGSAGHRVLVFHQMAVRGSATTSSTSNQPSSSFNQPSSTSNQPSSSSGGLVDGLLVISRPDDEQNNGGPRYFPLIVIECGLGESKGAPKSRQLFCYAWNVINALLPDKHPGPLIGIQLTELHNRSGGKLSVRGYLSLTPQTLGETLLWSGSLEWKRVAQVVRRVIEWAPRLFNPPTDTVLDRVRVSSTERRVFKAFDYRYSNPNNTYKRQFTMAVEFMQSLDAQVKQIAEDLNILEYNFLDGHHLPESVEQAAQLLEHLAQVHGRGVCHGDIRQANIVCSEAQSMLIDFDMAREVGSEDARYPPHFNHSPGDVTRHQEATAGSEMALEHDRYAMHSLLIDLSHSKQWKSAIDKLIDGTAVSLSEISAELRRMKPAPVFVSRAGSDHRRPWEEIHRRLRRAGIAHS